MTALGRARGRGRGRGRVFERKCCSEAAVQQATSRWSLLMGFETYRTAQSTSPGRSVELGPRVIRFVLKGQFISLVPPTGASRTRSIVPQRLCTKPQSLCCAELVGCACKAPRSMRHSSMPVHLSQPEMWTRFVPIRKFLFLNRARITAHERKWEARP